MSKLTDNSLTNNFKSDYVAPYWKWPQYRKANMANVPRARKARPPTTWLDKPFKFNVLKFIGSLDLAPAAVYEEKPAGYWRGPVPSHPLWREQLFILVNGLIPVAIQLASYLAFPNWKWSWQVAFPVYMISFVWFAGSMLRRIHYYMLYYGTFDEATRARDIISDSKVNRLGASILAFMVLRVAGVFVLGYDKEQAPMFDIWTPVKIGLWDIALDYYFYVYHRSTHQVDKLWWVHSRHHSTRHPTPLLSILADDVQETLEVMIIPLLASWTVPLRFHEQYLAAIFLVYVEAMGHSGIRAYWPHPILAPVLGPFEMELTIEDHDLHHRYGRSGTNFGKQTRIFDQLFGTVCTREEALLGSTSVADDLDPEAETVLKDGELKPKKKLAGIEREDDDDDE